MFRKRNIVIGIALLAFVVSVSIIIFSRGEETAVPTLRETRTGFFVRPDVGSLIAILFDASSKRVAYDWAIAAGERGDDQLIETVDYRNFDQAYQWLLATRKVRPDDETYTIADYLALTVDFVNKGSTDTLTYIDLEADGELDSVFLNDEHVTNLDIVVDAKNQYITELVLAREYILGKTAR